jgi:hypothetical protein
MADKKYVASLLDKLIELDVTTVGAYYEMGRILHSFKQGDLHADIGYESFGHMVEEELSYSTATAHSYSALYRHFQRLHYNKAEALDLLRKFGKTHLSEVLPSLNSKIGARAIKARIDNLGHNQINFTLDNEELAEAQRALLKMGAMKSDNGRYLNSSEAFMDMVREVNKKPVLKSVA